ncbi:MAG TPA: AAA family ATPase [Thermodesulfobacteriota bacterium]|nr:AAA family ATPase [Thermodesulfobacteriota bacterium]
MGKIISVTNQKGGVGKTATVVNLAAAMALSEKKTLIVDFDPQGNATSGVGTRKDQYQYSVYDFIINQVRAEEVILSTGLPLLKVIPADMDLVGAEIELVPRTEREKVLRKSLEALNSDFDYIFLDCPPSLGLLTVNALTAAHGIIVPTQCEYYALEGLGSLLSTIQMVQKDLNPQLTVEGILLTMFDGRNNLSSQVEKEVRSHLNDLVFNTVIPRNVRISESPSHGLPVLLYDPHCRGAQSYMELAQELLSREV